MPPRRSRAAGTAQSAGGAGVARTPPAKPAYPPAGPVLAGALWKHARSIFLGLAIILALHSPYVALSRHFDERSFFLLASFMTHNGTWLLVNGSLLVAEHFEIQAVLKHQIERRKPEVPSPSLLRKLYLQISLNHMITSPLLMWLLFPYVKRLGVPATARASLAFYNTHEEIDRLVAALVKTAKLFA